MKNDFASLLEESFKKHKRLESGAEYSGIVTSIKNDYIFIKVRQEDITGILSVQEFQQTELPKPKSEIKIFFLREDHGDYYFTSCLVGEDIHLENLELAKEREIPVLGSVSRETNGGYEIRLGDFLAFCPYSQIDSEWKDKQVQGKEFKFIINEIQQKGKKILVSQKKLSDKARELKKEILQSELKEGSFVTCKIKSIHNFGLIVDLNGLDALVPASEASFKKNYDINKEFQVGQILRAKILRLDWKENKISLTLKESIDDPWSKSVPYKEGDVVKGTVESIKPFGVFIKLDDHFHVLVPNKEVGLGHRVQATGHIKPGEVLEVFITEVNPAKRQIAASIAKAKETKDRMDYESYISGQESKNTSSFGLLLKKSLGK